MAPAGLGETAEAQAAFEHARPAFARRKLAYDCALVSLDLGLVLLPKGETAAVRTLAEEMVWIFSARAIHREALAALRLFCDAARLEIAPVELASRIGPFLARAREAPSLRYEDSAAAR